MRKHLQLILTLLLALFTAVSVIGCGETSTSGGDTSMTTGTGTGTSVSTTINPASQEQGDVVIAFLHAGNIQTSTNAVEAAVSAYVRSKLGFGIEFKLVNVFDLSTVYTNWLVAGEEIDLLNVAFVDPSLYINEKRVREIGSLITPVNTPYFYEELYNRPESLTYGSDGKLYGVSVWAPGGYTGYSYTVRKDVMELAGLYGEGEGKYMHLDQITYDDLDYIFAAIKEAMPETPQGLAVYPCSALSATQNYAGGFLPCDPMGVGSYPLAVMMMDPVTGQFSGEIENYYESDEYKEYVEWIGKTAENGYIHPDASVTTDWFGDFYEREQFVGVLLATDANIRSTWEMDNGWEMISLQLSTVYAYLSTPGHAMMIASKSERPNRTIQFLDLLYSDVELINMMQYGREGEEWDFASEEHGLIREASEGSRSNYVIGGFWGDYEKIYSYVNADEDLETVIAKKLSADAEIAALKVIAEDHYSPAWGFIYDTSAQITRIRNIDANVLSRYYNTLNIGAGSKGTDGTYTGPGSTYRTFIDALNKAKAYLVVEDKQTQYEAWLAEQED